MRCRCVVSYCENQARHKFPKHEDRRRQWIQAIKYVKPTLTIGPNSGVCSDHFRLSDFSNTPSYWNNYYPAKILKKSSVPSVFRWNDTSRERPSSYLDDLSLNPADLLSVEQSSVPDVLSFNPARVKATYSRGQTLSKLKPNAVPSPPKRSLLKINNPETETINQRTQKPVSPLTLENSKNLMCPLKKKKEITNKDYVRMAIKDVRTFLPPPATNINEKKLEISQRRKRGSILGKMRLATAKIGLPQNNGKIQGESHLKSPQIKGKIQSEGNFNSLLLPLYKGNMKGGSNSKSLLLSQNNCKVQNDTRLPPDVTIKKEHDVGKVFTDDILPNNAKLTPDDSIFTSSLPLAVTIKAEKDISQNKKKSQGENRSTSPSLPHESMVKEELEEETKTMVEIEIDMLNPIKQEISIEENMAVINL